MAGTRWCRSSIRTCPPRKFWRRSITSTTRIISVPRPRTALCGKPCSTTPNASACTKKRGPSLSCARSATSGSRKTARKKRLPRNRPRPRPGVGSQVTFRKYLVLAGITVFSTAGDSLLARGMKDFGGFSLHNFSGLLLAILNPWVALGILFLLLFFSCYMSALSWADLTYVLPATSLAYVLVALIGH